MSVAEDTAAGSFAYGGKDYFFCSENCLRVFKANPEPFAATAASAADQPTPPALASIASANPAAPKAPGKWKDPICSMTR